MAGSDINDRATKHKTRVCDVIIASWLQGQMCQGAKSCQVELTEEYKKLLSIQMKNLNPSANVGSRIQVTLRTISPTTLFR